MAALRAANYSVIFIAEISPGIDDTAVLEVARREQALLLTADKDFGELVFRKREAHFGVLLIRCPEEDAQINAANTLAAFHKHGHDLLNRFAVLSGRALRIRFAP